MVDLDTLWHEPWRVTTPVDNAILMISGFLF
jgi:hypothetical protein